MPKLFKLSLLRDRIDNYNVSIIKNSLRLNIRVMLTMKEILSTLILFGVGQADNTVFPMLGEYLLKGFSLLYHLSFLVLYKVLTVFFSESYWIRLAAVFSAFFASMYFILLIVKEFLKALIRMSLFLVMRILRLVLGGAMDSIEIALNKTFRLLTSGMRKIAMFIFNKRTVQTPYEQNLGHIPYFKIISNAEFEEFEKQLLKRGLVEKDFD